MIKIFLYRMEQTREEISAAKIGGECKNTTGRDFASVVFL